jgi:uncharacterized membrane protein
MRKSMKKTQYMALVVAVAALLFSVYPGIAGAAVPVTADSSGRIAVPVASLSGKLLVYESAVDGVKVRFFAVLGTDKKTRVAFDACVVCGGRLGYRQEGTDIVCIKCGRVFPISGIGTKNTGAGCWPSYLPFTTSGKNIVIKVDDLKKGKGLFL